MGWLVVQLLGIGFLARAFQLGYLTLGLAILRLGTGAWEAQQRAGTA